MAKGKWVVQVLPVSKSRHIERVFIRNGSSRQGYYPSVTEAQAECDARNAEASE